MLITLTGYMGCGKSTVGSLVADALGCPFLDLDALIEKKAGKTIPQIFAADGEAAFRQLEKKLLEETVKKHAGGTAVLALGGGTVTVPGAPALLHEKTLCIWLRATLETLLSRLDGGTGNRPLSGEGFAEGSPHGSPCTNRPPGLFWTPTAVHPKRSRTRLLSPVCNSAADCLSLYKYGHF